MSIKKIVLTLITTSIITCTPVNNSFAWNFMFKPSIGMDVGSRIMPFQNLYGKGHFANHYYHVSPYVEAQLLNNLSIQAGLEYSDTRKTLKQYHDLEYVLGNPVYTITDTNTLSFLRVKGKFIGLILNSNILCKKHNLPVELAFFIGINMMKIYSSFIDVTHADLTNEDFSLKNSTTRINSSNTIIPKFGLQLKYNFKTNNKINFKLGYYWQKTSSIKTSQIDQNNETFVIKPKNSSLLTIGFSYFI